MTVTGTQYILYRYNPSPPAAITFGVLFVLSTLAHTYQLAGKRTRDFIPFVVGGICKLSCPLRS